MRVLATDQGSSHRVSAASVAIGVRRNTGQPSFSQSFYDVFISEDTPVLQSIIQVLASDPDPTTSPYGQLWYSLGGPVEAQGIFRIDPDTGVLSTRISLFTVSQNQWRVSTLLLLLIHLD
jgi:hypothetical protein